ncbi:hypothetical protein INT48_009398 [Thamnidium elegans]|uniref:Methyltransferase domain-containing protein n=1 Tax=Thamnidium elegans TaxID=101142 RepID=A0A8H7SPA1_9FUNG|nr:hypothetical protein INT48_009398 [Thamnidium elegans]
MGNQASKVIEKTKERKERRSKNNRRRSTITLGGRSHSSLVMAATKSMQANYDWIDEKQDPSLISTPPVTKSRRQSITEFFSGRKKSLVQDDFKEYDRLQRQHYLLKSARKSNIWGVIEDGMTIVDVGTGNGIWALEMASEQLNCKVIGLDLRPPAEQQGKPKNLNYHEADITETWPLESESVDYIFQRNMGQSIQKDQWPHVLNEMLRVLKPGGTIELVEADLWHHNPGPVQRAFDEFYQQQCTELGLDFAFTEVIEKELDSIGFSELDLQLKQFGFINKEIQKAYLRNRKSFYISKWGVTPEDYELAVQEIMTEFEEYHGFSRFNCWIAKKPI